MAENVVAIIQARLGSSRLPLKSLLCLAGAPVIDWVCDRVGRAREVARVIVAIPDTDLDLVLKGHLERRGIECMAGPEEDVLARFCMVARIAKADRVVRVCADNPLIWPVAIDRLARFHREGKYDYAYNHIPRNNLWPDGLGAEILSRELLEEIDKKAALPAQREHCLNYIWDNSDQFRIGTFDPVESWLRRPEIKLDLDAQEDFRRLALMPISRRMGAKEIIAAWDGREKF